MNHEGTTVLETNYQVDNPSNIDVALPLVSQEIKKDDWDYELTNFVGANASELVGCPWQPGLEMTLSAITLEWPAPITAANVDSVLFELQQLLAVKRQKIEDEVAAIIDDDLELQDSTEQLESTSKQAEDSVERSTTVNKKTETAQKVITKDTATSALVSQSTDALKIDISNASISPTPYISASTEAMPSAIDNNHSTNEQPKAVAPQSYIKVQTPVPEVVAIHNAHIDTHNEVKQANTATEPPKVDSHAASHIITNPTAHIKAMPTKIEKVEPPIIDNNLLENIPINTEIIANDIVATQIYDVLDIEQPESDQLGLLENENTKQDDSSQTEHTLVEIAESITESEPETAQIASKLIAQIIEISSVDPENSVDEDKVLQETEEIFAELLDVLGIEYTPELLESLSSRTFSGDFRLNDLLKIDETEESDQASSTNKVVQQVAVMLTPIKTTVEQACVIGRYALGHYGLSITMSD